MSQGSNKSQVKEKHDTVHRLWLSLPTDAELIRRQSLTAEQMVGTHVWLSPPIHSASLMSHTLTLLHTHFTHPPPSTLSLEPPSQTTVMTATFSLASQRKNPRSAVVSSSLLTSSLCPPGHLGGGALYWTKTIPSLAQKAESCFSHTGGVGW